MAGYTHAIVAIYAIIVILALFGNLLIIAAIIKNKSLHQPVYIFLANQSFTDFVFVVLSFGDAAYFLMDSWEFQEAFCKIHGTIMQTLYTISIFSLVALATERYLEICRLKKTSIVTCFKSCFFIVFAALLVCSPMFHSFTVTPKENETNKTTTLYMCTTNNWSAKSELGYNIFHTVVAFALPLAILLITHSKIGRRLNEEIDNLKILYTPYVSSIHDTTSSSNGIGSRAMSAVISNKVDTSLTELSGRSMTNTATDKIPTTNTQPHIEEDVPYRFSQMLYEKKQLKAKEEKLHMKRIVKMLIIITSLFVSLWAPWFITRLVKSVVNVPHDTKWNQWLRKGGVDIAGIIWIVVQLVAFVSTTSNVFIYMGMSSAMRKTFHSLCCRKSEFKTGESADK